MTSFCYITPLAERRRNCTLTPLATSQQHNQGILSPAHLRRLRLLLDPILDHHSSEEELERIAGATGAEGGRKWHRHGDMSSASSDEEVKDLCGPNEPSAGPRLSATSPSPVLFSSSPPRALKPSHIPARLPVRPIILSHFEQPSKPYWRHRPTYTGELGRPSLDLEKMQQVRDTHFAWSSWPTRNFLILQEMTSPSFIDPWASYSINSSSLNPICSTFS